MDRRKLAGDWRKRLQAVQSSALAACREGLSGKLQAQLLAGSSDSAAGVSYLAALHLRDQLAVSADKTLLGYYKGEAGIVDKIVKVFEKGCEWHALPCSHSCLRGQDSTSLHSAQASSQALSTLTEIITGILGPYPPTGMFHTIYTHTCLMEGSNLLVCRYVPCMKVEELSCRCMGRCTA